MRTGRYNLLCLKNIISWLGWSKRTYKSHKVWLYAITLLITIIILGGLILSGCTGLRTVPSGWSGGTVAGDRLVIGSMEGELVAVDMTNGTRLWDATLHSPVMSGGGFLGCAPASSAAVAFYGSPAVAGNITYVGGYDGVVYAYKIGKEEVAELYPRRGTLGGSIVGGLVIYQDSIYFGCADGKVYALEVEAEGIFKKWEFKTGDKIWSTPAIDGDTLFVVSFDKKLYALDTETGQEKWEKPFEAEGVMVTPPVVYNNTVYVGSFDRHLYAVDKADGSLKWKFLAERWFWAKPIINNDVIYAPCLDGILYVLDAESGNEIGRLELERSEKNNKLFPISSSPVLDGDLLIVATEGYATEGGTVHAIDTDTNQVKWRNDDFKVEKHKIFANLCVGDGKVYIHSNKGELRALDVQSGTERWSISLKSE